MHKEQAGNGSFSDCKKFNNSNSCMYINNKKTLIEVKNRQ